MLSPLLGLILGLLLLSYTWLAYVGYPLAKHNLFKVELKHNNLFAIGLTSISVALMLGIIGYFYGKNPLQLRYSRLLLIFIGLLCLKINLQKNLGNLNKLPKYIRYLLKLNSEDILKLSAGLLLLFLFVKSIVSVDWMGGDSWMYQLPFAARIWGMVTPQDYIFERDLELLYGNSTMLANFWQGFFWFVFGLERPQGANLVSLISIIIYFIFLKHYLKIPIYLSALAILAVPLIHIAATGCYVDLPGNVCAAIAIIMAYLLYTKDNFFHGRNIVIFTIAAAGAANIKYLMVPPIAIVLLFVYLRIIWLYFPQWKRVSNAIKLKQLGYFCAISLICCLAIFATEFKNLILHGNPFFPLKVEIGGIVLNHLMVPSSDYMSDTIEAMSAPQRWLLSLLEINAFDDRRPSLWTIAMDFVPLNDDKFGMGGYFSIYVIFNLILFFTLCRRWDKETKVASILFLIVTVVTIYLPFSYQLRYYMYWIIVLISFNLFLSFKEQSSPEKLSFLKPINFGYVALATLFAFGILTSWTYTYPNQKSLAKFMEEGRVKPEIMAQIEEGDSVCLVGFTPLTFLYNDRFHPDKNYLVKSEFMTGKEDVREKCGDRRIIYN